MTYLQLREAGTDGCNFVGFGILMQQRQQVVVAVVLVVVVLVFSSRLLRLLLQQPQTNGKPPTSGSKSSCQTNVYKEVTASSLLFFSTSFHKRSGWWIYAAFLISLIWHSGWKISRCFMFLYTRNLLGEDSYVVVDVTTKDLCPRSLLWSSSKSSLIKFHGTFFLNCQKVDDGADDNHHCWTGVA